MKSNYPFSQIDSENSVIITASQRLARHLRQSYNQYQLSQGKKVWPSLKVMPWGAWQERCWQALKEQQQAPIVLNGLQVDYLWQQIVEKSEYNNYLLQTSATAKKAQQAWLQLQQWQLELKQEQVWDLDHKAFYRWQNNYKEKLAANNWLDSASSVNYLNQHLEKIASAFPANIYLAGFKQQTPQQKTHFSLLSEHTKTETFAIQNNEKPKLSFKSYDNVSDELVAIVASAKEHLISSLRDASSVSKQNQNKQLAIVIPDLEKHKSLLENILWQELDPNQFRKNKSHVGKLEATYDISLGEPLAKQPMVYTALLLLKLLHQRLDKSELQWLLLSPYFSVETEDQQMQFRLEKSLKSNPKEYWLFENIQELLGHNKETEPLADKLKQAKEQVSQKLTIRDWMQQLPLLLNSMAWAERVVIESFEHQVQQTFFDSIKQLQQFHLLFNHRLSFDKVLELLNKIVESKDFHQERPKAPIQIMGLLESVGLEFDKVWLSGANNQTLPQPANPNPFLPQALLRQFEMPGNSNAREWRYSQKIFSSLQAGTKSLEASYSRKEGDAEILPSPLLTNSLQIAELAISDVPACHSKAASFVAKLLDCSYQKSYQDEVGQALSSDAMPKKGADIKGGTGFFKAQINCPFQAYAKYRLSAYEFEEVEEGLSPIERGNIVHQVLEEFWKKYKHSHILRDDEGKPKTEEQLLKILKPIVHKVLKDNQEDIFFLRIERFASIEEGRLSKLILKVLQLDQKRPAFSNVESESLQKISISGLNFKMKIDRMDSVAELNTNVPEAGKMIIDYKTGKPTKASLTCSPPSEPQLPLYAISQKVAVEGIAFLSIHSEATRYIGLADEPANINAKKTDNIPMVDYIARWKEELEQVADDIKQGIARVEPRNCNYCDYKTFCRINERELSATVTAKELK